MRLLAALSLALFTALATSTAAQAHLPFKLYQHDSLKQKLRTIRLDLPHVCYSHRAGCHWLRGLQERLSARLRASELPIAHLTAWLCIHSHEGSWSDAGDPYWGGLQMDRGFMGTYAPRWLLRRGFANVWTPRQQMYVAEQAYRTRGFSPWPNTARICGLL